MLPMPRPDLCACSGERFRSSSLSHQGSIIRVRSFAHPACSPGCTPPQGRACDLCAVRDWPLASKRSGHHAAGCQADYAQASRLMGMMGCEHEAHYMPGHDAGGSEGDEIRGMALHERCSPNRV